MATAILHLQLIPWAVPATYTGSGRTSFAAPQTLRRRTQRAQTPPAAGGRTFEVRLDHHNCRGALAILHDVTEHEHVERVRRHFVANISHELRMLLAAMRKRCGRTETHLSRDHLLHHHLDLCRIGPFSYRYTAPEERVSVREAIQSAREGGAARAVKWSPTSWDSGSVWSAPPAP